MAVHWSLWLIVRVAGLATGISVAMNLWLAAVSSARVWPSAATAGQWSSARAWLEEARLPVVVIYFLAASSGFCKLNQAGLIAAGALSATPLALGRLRSAFGSIDPAIDKAARSLGASGWLIFSRVQLPLAIRPVLVSAGSAFLCVLAELALCWWWVAKGPAS